MTLQTVAYLCPRESAVRSTWRLTASLVCSRFARYARYATGPSPTSFGDWG
jgi:hypothetical protein